MAIVNLDHCDNAGVPYSGDLGRGSAFCMTSDIPDKQTTPDMFCHFDQVSVSSFRYQRVVFQKDLLFFPSVNRGGCYVLKSSELWWPGLWRGGRRRWRSSCGTFWRTWRVGTIDHLLEAKVGDLNHLRNRMCVLLLLAGLK